MWAFPTEGPLAPPAPLPSCHRGLDTISDASSGLEALPHPNLPLEQLYF